MISDKDLQVMINNAKTDYEEYFSDEGFISALEELQQRRASDLRPTKKFLCAGKIQQLEKIKSEVIEFEIALENIERSFMKYGGCTIKDIEHTLEELVDVQTACETMMAILGADDKRRNDIRRQVIEKNAKRGYYEDDTK